MRLVGIVLAALAVSGISSCGSSDDASSPGGTDGGSSSSSDDLNTNSPKRFVILEDKGTEAAFVSTYDGAGPSGPMFSFASESPTTKSYIAVLKNR